MGLQDVGKSRRVVIPSIGNLAFAEENMIISDPKGELHDNSRPILEAMGYNVLTLDFKDPLKSNRYNFLQPVINAVNDKDIALAEDRASDIVEALVPDTKR